MSAVRREPQADPLFARPRPERPAYATGMLLGARDFADEQTYHRGQLARALAYVAGPGTLAGLRVGYVSPTDAGGNARPEEIRVEPGLAVDWLGRLIEVPRAACLRLPAWFDGQADDARTQAAYPQGGGNLGGFISARALAEAGGALPARVLVADLYLRFVACDAAWSPAFASGPYDALDAIAASRVRDAYELQLLPRTGLQADATHGLPDMGPDLSAIADPAARRAALQDHLLDDSYQGVSASAAAGTAGDLKALSGNPDGADPSAVWLARLLLPVQAGNPPLRLTPVGTPVIDNYSRRFLPAAALLSRWLGA
jgi:hypothetical protein